VPGRHDCRCARDEFVVNRVDIHHLNLFPLSRCQIGLQGDARGLRCASVTAPRLFSSDDEAHVDVGQIGMECPYEPRKGQGDAGANISHSIPQIRISRSSKRHSDSNGEFGDPDLVLHQSLKRESRLVGSAASFVMSSNSFRDRSLLAHVLLHVRSKRESLEGVRWYWIILRELCWTPVTRCAKKHSAGRQASLSSV